MDIIIKTLLGVTLLSSVMILSIMAVKAIWPDKINIKIISFLWLLVLARLIIPVTLESPLHFDSLLPETIENSQPEQTVDAQIDNTFTNINSAFSDFHQDMNFDTANTSETPDAIVKPSFWEKSIRYIKAISLWSWAFIAWIAGSLFLLARSVYLGIKFSIKTNKTANLNNRYLNNLLDEAKACVNIHRPVRIFPSRHVDVPVVFGAFRPKIILPARLYVSVTRDKLKLILLHELCHIKRRDMLTNILWLVAKAVHWFNPLVWIAYSMHLDDIELACDDMVIAKAGHKDGFKYSQSLIDVIKSSKKLAPVPVALPFCENKNKLRKRVMNMIQPQKKLKSAGLISLLLAMLMVIGCFTTACQPTPEEVLVRSKAGNEMEEIIQMTADPDISINPQTETASEHITQSQTNDLETITVNFNADVVAPGVDKIPSAVVGRGSFTQEQVDSVINRLIGDANIYEMNAPLTKSQIDEEIIKIKRQSTDLNSDMAQSEGITSLDDLQARANELIAEYQKIYDDAPETLEYAVANTDINHDINFYADLGKAEKASFILWKMNKGDQLLFHNFGDSNQRQFSIYGNFSDSEEDALALSLDDAKAYAYLALEEMNIHDFVISRAFVAADDPITIGAPTESGEVKQGEGRQKKYYVFYFERKINNVNITNAFHSISIMDEEDPAYANPLFYETMIMWIDETGIVQFEWKSPTQIVEILNNDVDIQFSVEQAVELVSKQLFIEYADMYFGYADQIIIDINEINLGLARIRYKGHPGEYIVVPVWDFYGNVKVQVPESSSAMDELTKGNNSVHPIVDGMPTINKPLESIITVNALDGTIINRDIGY